LAIFVHWIARHKSQHSIKLLNLDNNKTKNQWAKSLWRHCCI